MDTSKTLRWLSGRVNLGHMTNVIAFHEEPGAGEILPIERVEFSLLLDHDERVPLGNIVIVDIQSGMYQSWPAKVTVEFEGERVTRPACWPGAWDKVM